MYQFRDDDRMYMLSATRFHLLRNYPCNVDLSKKLKHHPWPIWLKITNAKLYKAQPGQISYTFDKTCRATTIYFKYRNH